jgi:hypothetical protein
MIKLLTFAEAIEKIGEKIKGYDFMCYARREPSYFSREGKIGFVNLFAFMLNFVKKSMQLELDLFMEMRKEQERITKQAFSQARQKISFEAFKDLFEDTVKIASEVEDMNTLKGLRIFAVDGTSLALENTKELLEYFGCSGRGTTSATARVSALYDVLNEYIVDANIEKFSSGERELATKHIEKIKEMGKTDNLIIFDRGYASSELISEMSETSVHFLMRVRKKFNLNIDALRPGEGKVAVKHNGKTYKVRVVKFLLDTGEEETLITDLSEKLFCIDELKDLYFRRWPIETRYDIVKTKLQLENFTGKTVLSVLQDFYASMFLSNMASFAKYVADEKIKKANENRNLKYEYRTNVNLMIGKLKDRLVIIMLDDNPKRREKAINRLCSEIARNVVPIRPDRYTERKLPRKKRFHMNIKYVL